MTQEDENVDEDRDGFDTVFSIDKLFRGNYAFIICSAIISIFSLIVGI